MGPIRRSGVSPLMACLVAGALTLPPFVPHAASATAVWSARDPLPWSQARAPPAPVCAPRRGVPWTCGGVLREPGRRFLPLTVADSGFIRFDPADLSGPVVGLFAGGIEPAASYTRAVYDSS